MAPSCGLPGPASDSGPVRCSPHVDEDAEWADLWETFELRRLLCARPEVWEARFVTGLATLLAPHERVALPGQAAKMVLVFSDAKLEAHAACDVWRGRLIVYAGDNMNVDVRSWLRKRAPRPRAARQVLRLLTYVEITFGLQVLTGYAHAHRNATADLLQESGQRVRAGSSAPRP